jgi:hypothetical protein
LISVCRASRRRCISARAFTIVDLRACCSLNASPLPAEPAALGRVIVENLRVCVTFHGRCDLGAPRTAAFSFFTPAGSATAAALLFVSAMVQ